jgi:hypothetical protein
MITHWTIQPTISLPWRRGPSQLKAEPVKPTEEDTRPIWRDETLSSTDETIQFKQRFKELGLLAKSSRKRLKDLFDIESLGSLKNKQDSTRKDECRVPVMPPAPNASVRIPSQRAKSTKSYAVLRNASMRKARHSQSQSEGVRPAYLEEIRIAMTQNHDSLNRYR